MNKIILMGRLTRDPEVRTGNGSTVARYTLAVDRRFKRDGDPDADFFNCTAFGKGAEFAEKYLKQGTKIAITGRIQSDNYTNKDGQKVYFDLVEEPETTFENGLLFIKTARTTVSYQLENVLRYTYEGEMPVVDGLKLKPGEMRFVQGKEQMNFDGLADGTLLEVYTLDGKKLQEQKARSGQRTVVSFANRPAGTYIEKVGDTTYKFLKQ